MADTHCSVHHAGAPSAMADTECSVHHAGADGPVSGMADGRCRLGPTPADGRGPFVAIT